MNKPNAMSRFPLPPDATFLPMIETLKLGGWLPMKYDAEMTRHGVRWLRVYGGMSDRFDREDWVADLPISVSIHDYQWNGEDFGADHGTMDNACYRELMTQLDYVHYKRAEAVKTLHMLSNVIEQLSSIFRATGHE